MVPRTRALRVYGAADRKLGACHQHGMRRGRRSWCRLFAVASARGVDVVQCVGVGLVRDAAQIVVTLGLLAGLPACSMSGQLIAQPSRNDVTETVRKADLSARGAATLEGQDGQYGRSKQSLQPMLYPGSETRTPEPSPRELAQEVQIASAQPGAILPGAGIEMNFEGADVQTVAKTLLGDMLGLNFVIDPAQGRFAGVRKCDADVERGRPARGKSGKDRADTGGEWQR